jgi:iron complex outermembrane receptor protein
LPIFTTQRQRFLATSLFAAELLAPAVGAAAPSLVDFDLPAGPLSISLQNFAKKTHLQLLFSSAGMADRKAPALHGRFTPDQALARLIKDSGLLCPYCQPRRKLIEPDFIGLYLVYRRSMLTAGSMDDG